MIALNSWGDINTGIGSEARWLWRMLPFDVWLQAHHPKLGWGREQDVPPHRVILKGWGQNDLQDISTLVCIERPVPHQGLLAQAKMQGIRTVVLCNPEWTHHGWGWVQYADLIIARTNASYRHLKSLGLHNIARCNVPIDVTEFNFIARSRIDMVSFSDGWGGVKDRKGWPEVRELLAAGGDYSITVFSQRGLVGSQGERRRASSMYDVSGLMLVPSRFEGLGLTVLEAMASGCLVAATDAEPMRQFIRAAYGSEAWRFLLPVADRRSVSVGGQEWVSHHIDTEAALHVIAEIKATHPDTLLEMSMAGRKYIMENHAEDAANYLWSLITR